MTPQQQQKVIDSMWIVNTVLKRQGIDDEDLKQDAILYLCKTLERFDAEVGVKWETYAYKNVYLYIKRQKLRQIKVNSRYCNEIIIGRVYEPSLEYMSLKRVCSDNASKLLDLRLQGYTNREAQKIMKVSGKTVLVLNREIKEKAKEIL